MGPNVRHTLQMTSSAALATLDIVSEFILYKGLMVTS